MITDSEKTVLPPFDQAAQDRIAALFRNCPPEEFFRELRSHQPTTRDEEVVFEKYYGWGLEELGRYGEARVHMLRALRLSRPSSRDRAHVRGLLGYVCVQMGRVAVAERCSERALSDIPPDDDGYLRAGHLGLRGRIYRAQGHLTHAIETFRRALAIIDGNSPHYSQMIAQLVYVLQLRGDVHEAGALIRAHRDAAARGDCTSMDWVVAETEAIVDLELGELDQAEHALERALANPVNTGNERIRFVLQSVLAEVMQARGMWAQSERILST
ncbi:MAG: hypothetical protein ACRENS_05450, partial [Candidatus Eiseniibacteriota bacterium]